MRVLVAFEYTGVVRDAFKKRGHYAVSADFRETLKSGLHYKGNALDILNDNWDLMIAHPPCTHLASSGAKHFARKRTSGVQGEAAELFMRIWKAPIRRICIENPVGIMSRIFRKPDQYVQPYWFGDPYQKKTGLWLKNLPLLKPTDMVTPEPMHVTSGGKRIPKWYSNKKSMRDKTFPGLANAMAKQWG